MRTLRAITFRTASLPIASALAIALAFVSPPISNVAYVLIGIMMEMAPLHARSRRQPLDVDDDKRQNMPRAV